MNLFSLTGMVAIITGSSRGIGRAIAEAYAAAGAQVVISSRTQPACDEVADAIKAQHGEDRALAVAASISDRTALEALVSTTRRKFGKIDVLVCNAASNPYYGPMSGISDEQFRKVFENNVLSNHWLISMVTPDMVERKDGAVIVVSSIGAMVGSEVIGAYNISKAADLQLVRNLAIEYGQHNIRINAIAPGVIRTDFAKALYEDPQAEAALRRAVPLGRIGEAGEIAGAAIFLASKASSYITGQSIVVDGGTLIRGSL
jgi:NAD(P)-dependent dehydrogenase (short-subunit alcohol dehydrogenase family)